MAHGITPTGTEIGVLVVDDSLFMRTALIDILQADDGITVVGQAANGVDAVRLAKELRPDVVTLDLIMPQMDGQETLRHLMRLPDPPAVVIVSAHVQDQADRAVECLADGAVDVIEKPVDASLLHITTVADELRAKVKAASMAQRGYTHRKSHHQAMHIAHPDIRGGLGVVVIGSSTGGPFALEQVVSQLPAYYPFPIVIAQHLPASFVRSLVHRLQEQCKLPIRIAQSGDVIEAGVVYFCPGGADTSVQVDEGTGVAVFTVRPPASSLSPSVDALFASTVRVFGRRVIGIVLTGMGTDGLRGAAAIREAGGKVYAQDERTSVVYGMPRAVAEAGLATAIVSLDGVGALLGSMGGTHHE